MQSSLNQKLNAGFMCTLGVHYAQEEVFFFFSFMSIFLLGIALHNMRYKVA